MMENNRICSRVIVMGILNVTPDSFSDGGRYSTADDALRSAYEMLEAGADIIDIGGQSTRPGAQCITAETEWERLKPVLTLLAKQGDVTLSVDTFHAATAARSLELGVQIINDVRGGQADPAMLPLIATAHCDYIWMHNRTQPAERDPVETVLAETLRGIKRCLEAGIARDRLWLDPGIGFGKTAEDNLCVLSRLSEFVGLGFPVLLGTSRKRFIGHVLDVPVDDRLEGSLATVAYGVLAGVAAVRVHDVQATVRTCRMLEAIAHAGSAAG